MTTYVKGDEVPFNFSSGIIIASFFVSLVGSITTVELLHRKREGKGWMIWRQHLAISVSFGLVAIWCMHFVGNRAIILGNGEASLQLYYNGGFTALSVFLPIIFLFFGFTTVEFRQPGQRFFWPFLVLAGIIAGLAITGMHYVGNFGIANYRTINPAGFVVGAAAIAITASVIALTLFFYFKERWINSWAKRLICACLLAGAVSGMHWTASVGTRYILNSTEGQSNTMSRDTNLIVAIVVSLLACILCLSFAVLRQRRKKQLADRAQHVVLASATFEPDGKILVTNEGLLPCQKVTRQFNQRSFTDEFNTAHPVFQWLFRVTFNWAGVSDLVPAMRNHLRAVMTSKDAARPVTPGGENWHAGEEETPEEYSIIFREHFCVAAHDLADSLGVPLSELGVLHNGIMMTGSLASDFQTKKNMRLPSRAGEKSPQDMESGAVSTMFGRGQLLFLVRTVDKAQVARLMTAGYRFAQPNHVGDIIARSMQVPQNEMLNTIDRLQKYGQQCAEAPLEASHSTYLACYAMRASLTKANGNWEVLVPIDSPFQLPQVELTNEPLKSWQQRILTRLDGLSVNQCLSWLNNKAADCQLPGDKLFLELLLDQVTALTISVPEGFFGQAVFSSKPIRIDGMTSHYCNAPVQIFAFCIIPDVHSASIKSTNKLIYVPLSFFRCFQRVYKGSPDHAILARKIHREFGAILGNVKGITSTSSSLNRDSLSDSIVNSAPRRNGSIWPFSKGITPRRGSLFTPDTSSDVHLTNKEEMPPASQPFGGIMVSSDTTVEIHAKDAYLEMQDMGLKTEAGIGADEEATYVDELFRLTSTRWRQH